MEWFCGGLHRARLGRAPCRPNPARGGCWIRRAWHLRAAGVMSLQNVALIVADRPGRMVEKTSPVRDRRRCDPTASRRAAEFTKGWLGVQSPGKERLRANP